MESSLTLLEMALKKTSTLELGKAIGIKSPAISDSKKRRHLSPLMAGQIAVFLNENVEKWVTIAAIECARKSKAKTLLKKHLEQRLETKVKPRF